MLLIDDTLFIVTRPGLWLDSLHIQAITGKATNPRMVVVQNWGSVFLTNSVLQGDAQTNPVGLQVHRSLQGMYVESVLRCPCSCLHHFHSPPAESLQKSVRVVWI